MTHKLCIQYVEFSQFLMNQPNSLHRWPCLSSPTQDTLIWRKTVRQRPAATAVWASRCPMLAIVRIQLGRWMRPSALHSMDEGTCSHSFPDYQWLFQQMIHRQGPLLSSWPQVMLHTIPRSAYIVPTDRMWL